MAGWISIKDKLENLTPGQKLLDWLCGMVWEGTLVHFLTVGCKSLTLRSFVGSFAGILCIPMQSKLIYLMTLNF